MEARTGRVRKTISLLFHLSWIFGFFAIVILLYLRAQPLPDTFVPQTSQIYDVHGKWIDRFYVGENRQVIPLEAMSPYVIQATLAIEDHRFYHHFGFDLKGIARAILVKGAGPAQIATPFYVLAASAVIVLTFAVRQYRKVAR